MEITAKTNQKGNTYYVFELTGLELLLFGKDLFWETNQTDVLSGNVMTKYWNTDEFYKVGDWKKPGDNLEFNVSGLGEFTALPIPKRPGKFVVTMDPIPKNALNKLAYDAKMKVYVPENTELSLYILNSLWKD